MKLQAGKWYKTRNGKQVYVAAIIDNIPDGIDIEPYVVGFLNNDGYWSKFSWHLDGSFVEGLESNIDIIEEL